MTTTSPRSSDNNKTSSTHFLHYGFDWSSYPIGQVWGPLLAAKHPPPSGSTPVSDLEYYWLQYALTKDGNVNPALFRFDPGDSLTFVIWDLTRWTTAPTGVTFTGCFAMNALGGATYKSGNGGSDITVTDYLSCSTTSGLSWSGSGDQKYIQFTGGMTYYQSLYLLSPVGVASGSNSSVNPGPLTFDSTYSDYSCIMNFCLQVQIGTDKKLFVAEPEAYIGSGKT